MSPERQLIETCKDALIDDFATLVGFIRDGNLVQAAVFSNQMSFGLGVFAEMLANEALVEMLNSKFGKPEIPNEEL